MWNEHTTGRLFDLAILGVPELTRRGKIVLGWPALTGTPEDDELVSHHQTSGYVLVLQMNISNRSHLILATPPWSASIADTSSPPDEVVLF